MSGSVEATGQGGEAGDVHLGERGAVTGKVPVRGSTGWIATSVPVAVLSAACCTTEDMATLLLSGCASLTALAAFAVPDTVPVADGIAENVTVAVAPLAIAPSLHPAPLQAPCVEEADVMVAPVEISATSNTPAASAGPLLVAVNI